MDLSAILRPEAVKLATTFSSKKRLFQEIGEIAATVHGLKPRAVVDALMERESLGPTGVGNGIALPHARLADVPHVTGIFIRAEKPFDFESVDRKQVDLVFALLAPEEAGVEHLKALAAVSRKMRDSGLCAKLRANSDAATLHAVLTEGEHSKAA